MGPIDSIGNDAAQLVVTMDDAFHVTKTSGHLKNTKNTPEKHAGERRGGRGRERRTDSISDGDLGLSGAVRKRHCVEFLKNASHTPLPSAEVSAD